MMDRRKFLGAGATALATLALPKSLQAQSCSNLTQADKYGYGPYYLTGAPDRARIAAQTEPGEKLSITGKVFNCAGAMPGMSLEVWQATHTGCYIHPSQPACPDGGVPEVSRLWGKILSDAQGNFTFDTIKPGKYLNGAKYRPSHIHFRIRTPSGASTPLDLVTQLYFQGDPDIVGDFAADDPSAATRIIPLSRTNAGSPWTGVFNVVVPGGITALGKNVDPMSDAALQAFDVAVERRGSNLLFHIPSLPASEEVELRLYDAAGSVVIRSLHVRAPVELKSGLLSRGTYVVELRWNTKHGMRKESVSVKI